MKLIDHFIISETHTLKNEKLPGEYYVLRKNFDLLLRLFKVKREICVIMRVIVLKRLKILFY